MPASRPLSNQQDQEEALQDLLQKRNQLERLDAELTLYDPNGPWRFFEERLRRHEARARTALETGPVEEVIPQRKVLSVIRDLLRVPDEVRRQREQLAMEMEQ